MNSTLLYSAAQTAELRSTTSSSRLRLYPAVIASALLLSGCGAGSDSVANEALGPSASVESNSLTSDDVSVGSDSLSITTLVESEEEALSEMEHEDRDPQAEMVPVNEGVVFGNQEGGAEIDDVASIPLLDTTSRHDPIPDPDPTVKLLVAPAKSPSLIAPRIVTLNPAPSVASARIGAWSPVVPWPLVAIHAAALPDGRVMTFGTDIDGKQGGKFVYDVWQPFSGTGADSHLTLPNMTSTDLFCGGQLVLPMSGDLLINGGDLYNEDTKRTTNKPNKDATLFRLTSNSLERAGTMNRPRWYASATTLPNGEVYLQGGSGGNDRAEVRGLDGNFRLLNGFTTSKFGSTYPRNFAGPDGNIFGMKGTAMYRINPRGQGALTLLPQLMGYDVTSSSAAVMYQPGKILHVGGIDNKAAVIDIRGSVPLVSSAGTMYQARHWAGATVLADGRVAVTGGSATSNVADRVSYQMELFDPRTTSWTLGPAAQRMRLYHSTSLLLADGSLLTAGGGAPGPQRNRNAEIYYPPYLFKLDGTTAVRPTLTAAPTTVNPSTNFMLVSPQASSIARITMVAIGSVTHSVDMSQRFIELNFYRDGERLVASLPVNGFETPPGYYMVFAINTSGTPSVARIVRVNVK